MVIVAQAKFSEIVDAFDFVSAAPPMENAAYLSRESGAVYWYSEDVADLDELPADVEEDEKYLLIPHKNDLGLGKSLALRFAELSLADDIGKVREIFSHRGAYARFKDLLEYRGLLNRWYEFEASAQKQALREWCRQNGVEIDG